MWTLADTIKNFQNEQERLRRARSNGFDFDEIALIEADVARAREIMELEWLRWTVA